MRHVSMPLKGKSREAMKTSLNQNITLNAAVLDGPKATFSQGTAPSTRSSHDNTQRFTPY